MPDFIGRLPFATDEAAALLELQRDFRAELLQARIKSRVRGHRSRRAKQAEAASNATLIEAAK